MNGKVKVRSSPKSMISLRGARKLTNYLVRAKICPIERSVGSFKCAKNAEKYAQWSIKLKTLLLQLRLRHAKPITD